MKILDKYVTRSFLIGYAIAFCVLIGLRVIIDLFINLDEFAEHANIGFFAIVKNILVFYGLNATLYFRDFAGMITVVAAAFSLGKMVRNNELVAMMASGISLKRVIAPIILLSMISAGLLVIDQEFIIPPLAPQLVRSKDTLPGQESYNVRGIIDASGSLICTQKFDMPTVTMKNPTIVLRRQKPNSLVWDFIGRIDAEEAVYNFKTNRWDLKGGLFTGIDPDKGRQRMAFYQSDITPHDIPIRINSDNKTLLSSWQLSVLAQQGTKIKDMAQLYSQKHFRITDPIISMVMLLISLPVLVCRDPKAMKSAVMISFGLTGACFLINFVCKLFATEVIFQNRIIPELWAWLPVILFLPIAIVEFDSMKT